MRTLKFARQKVGRVFQKSEVAVWKFLNRFLIDPCDYKKTIFLAGTGRSGTTWVEEIINTKNDFRIMFEPFHSLEVDCFSAWNYRQYLRADDRSEKYLKPATAVLSGKIRNKWIDQFNRTLFPQKRLIKDIRAHHILKWINRNFNEIPIILLIRHPCAVANSKLELRWETHLQEFLRQDELMEDFLEPFRSEIQEAKNPFEEHIFLWCIENYVPLRQFNEGEILVIFYEDICLKPREAIEKIFSFIGEEFMNTAVDASLRPSALSRNDSAIISGKSLTSAWRSCITEEQVDRAVQILGMFGLQDIYGESDFPLISGSEALRLLPSD